MKERGSTSAAAKRFSVGDEIEAYLAGRYVAWCEERGRAVPLWARLNGLAHCPHAQAAAWLLATSPQPLPPGWPAALGDVARAVVAASATAGGFEQVRRTLVELELDLAAVDFCAEATPARLVALVRAALAPDDAAGPG